jgi:hypothetical protein
MVQVRSLIESGRISYALGLRSQFGRKQFHFRRVYLECRKVKGEPLDFTCFPRTDIYMKGSLATDWV